MGGCVQTRWSRKAKKRRLLLTGDLRFATASAWCWCILDYEQVGYHRSAEQLYRRPTSFTIVYEVHVPS